MSLFCQDTFKELYDVITKDLVSITRSVHVYYVGEINNKWIYVEEGLYDEMKVVLEIKRFNKIKQIFLTP
ncbi:20854_t:CDS:2 [Rhizophagus irregularis]|nr:20854_t:CDS:2 [Rhizophagus irregularis]